MNISRFLLLNVLLSVWMMLSANPVWACVVKNSNGQPATLQNDKLFSLLKTTEICPANVQELKLALQQNGQVSQPYMVANRGIHNPNFGSFSFFEEVGTGGEFFFGHFTALENNLIVADQKPNKGALMIELIAWDQVKNVFNFYELIGMGTGSQWFYRGDSKDILADNARLNLNPSGPAFGSSLRCSACHTSGGPIMKEMAAPHNDWWRKERPLKFAPNQVSAEVTTWVQKLGNAYDFSLSVKAGIAKLEQSTSYQKAKQQISLQAILRPLFCETEINLQSDSKPFEHVLDSVQIPTAFMVNPILAKGPVSIDSLAYQQLLNSFDMQFPETGLRDADHAWLVPVKGHSDLLAIQSLIDQGVVNDEFVADVLAVDFENPLLSVKRCKLLQLVPAEGLAGFSDRLKSSALPGADELFNNLTNPERSKNFHMEKAQQYLAKAQSDLKTADGQKKFFKKLLNDRQAVFDAEISKNPRGQILEPGFRVIFPVPKAL